MEGEVTFIELALDFESYTRQPIIPMPERHACPRDTGPLPVSERARLLRAALAILDRHKRIGRVCPGAMIARSMSLVPLGGAVMVGLNVRPYFAARMAMREHLLALQEYNVRRWSSLRINQLRGTPSTALPATGEARSGAPSIER